MSRLIAANARIWLRRALPGLALASVSAAVHAGIIITNPNPVNISMTGDLNFGIVEVGQSAERTMVVRNGNNFAYPVNIQYPALLSGSWSGELAPGASQEVTVTFSPTEAGAYSGKVSISENVGNGWAIIHASLDMSGTAKVLHYSSSNLPKEIPEKGRTVSKLTVSGQPKTILLSEVALTLSLEHVSIDDLVITLQPPRGTAMTIREREGAGAGLEIVAQGLPSDRQTRPNGTWTLVVEDRVKNGKAGILKSWKLRFP